MLHPAVPKQRCSDMLAICCIQLHHNNTAVTSTCCIPLYHNTAVTHYMLHPAGSNLLYANNTAVTGTCCIPLYHNNTAVTGTHSIPLYHNTTAVTHYMLHPAVPQQHCSDTLHAASPCTTTTLQWHTTCCIPLYHNSNAATHYILHSKQHRFFGPTTSWDWCTNQACCMVIVIRLIEFCLLDLC